VGETAAEIELFEWCKILHIGAGSKLGMYRAQRPWEYPLMLKRAAIASGLVFTLAAAVIGPLAWHYFINHNWRTVEDGFFYGSRQMSGDALAEAFEDYGIRTVVNMRSENPEAEWYQEEVAACAAHKVSHVNFAWSKSRIPDPESLLALLDLLENGEPPFLVHCQGGTHRTGTAAAVWLLDQGATPEIAREQFTLGFNDAPIGDIVALYEGSPLPFRTWVQTDYPALYEQWKAKKEAEAEQE
jgi:protein tyrosine phosphatase (PTP) superfamily phosphohydrolase (DUF442 family)